MQGDVDVQVPLLWRAPGRRDLNQMPLCNLCPMRSTKIGRRRSIGKGSRRTGTDAAPLSARYLISSWTRHRRARARGEHVHVHSTATSVVHAHTCACTCTCTCKPPARPVHRAARVHTPSHTTCTCQYVHAHVQEGRVGGVQGACVCVCGLTERCVAVLSAAVGSCQIDLGNCVCVCVCQL